MMVIGRSYNPSVPTAPGDVVSIASKDRPWYGLYLGGAEVNLYLAEFAMINGDEAAAEVRVSAVCFQRPAGGIQHR